MFFSLLHNLLAQKTLWIEKRFLNWTEKSSSKSAFNINQSFLKNNGFCLHDAMKISKFNHQISPGHKTAQKKISFDCFYAHETCKNRLSQFQNFHHTLKNPQQLDSIIVSIIHHVLVHILHVYNRLHTMFELVTKPRKHLHSAM